jgi:VWFA-related protein
MSIRRGGWICLFCLSLGCGFARQDEPAEQAKPASAVSPGSADRRITLDVVVTDKSGKPVSGLQQADFTLLDNKQPTRIVSFRGVDGGAAADRPVEAILLFDEINTAYSRMIFAREQIRKYVQKLGGELPVPMSIAYLTDKGVVAMEETATRDAGALLNSLDRHKNGLRALGATTGAYGAAERQQLSVKDIGEIVKKLAAKPGRKLVIWISPGWPMLSGPSIELSAKDRQWIFDALVALSGDLRLAGITLYHVDPQGLGDTGQVQSTYYMGFLKGLKTPREAQFANMALQVFAVQTGGRVLNASNDVAAEIATCVGDATAYYSVSFDGLAGDGPNEYHALEIKLGKPGLKALTRTGYYAQPGR